MNFAFSAEQEEFRSMLARFVEAQYPIENIRSLTETESGYDESKWKRMNAELGIAGVAIPEAHGGQGFTVLELGLALEQLGRNLAGGPLFATACLAAPAILAAGSEDDRNELLPAIADGSTIATLAFSERDGHFDGQSIQATCAQDGDGWTVSGTKSWVIDAPNADLIVVAARIPGTRGEDGVSLLAVKANDPGVRIEPVDALDLTRRLGSVTLDGATARMLGEPGVAWPVLERILDQAAVCLTAEQIGGAARCLEMAVQYSKERIQFGRSIGSFQAIKHRCATVKLDLELARSASYWAWWVASEHPEELQQAASIAKSLCSETYLLAAAENVHIHGGMGFTWEHDAHLFYRRAKSSSILFGGPGEHRARIAAELGFGGTDA